MLIFGEEPLLNEEEIKAVRQLLTPDFEPLNYTLMDEKNIDVDKLIETMEAVPFMDEFRLIVLRNSEIFKSGEKGLKKEEEDNLLKYLENPSPTSVLIFAPHEVDKRSSLYKKIKKHHKVIESKRLEMLPLKKWCMEQGKGLTLSLKEDLWQLFITRSGYLHKDSERDLSFLHQELSKLAALTGKGQQIGEEEIRGLFPAEVEGDVFRFTDYVTKGQTKSALLLYHELIEKGESPLMLLSMLARQFSLIARCHLLIKQGYNSAVIAQKLDIHPYAAKKAVESTKYLDRKQARDLLRTCLDTEFRIKTGRLREAIGVELIVMKSALCKNR